MIASVRYRTVLMATNMLSAVNHGACMMFWAGTLAKSRTPVTR
jgi:hypothetical protein